MAKTPFAVQPTINASSPPTPNSNSANPDKAASSIKKLVTCVRSSSPPKPLTKPNYTADRYPHHPSMKTTTTRLLTVMGQNGSSRPVKTQTMTIKKTQKQNGGEY